MKAATGDVAKVKRPDGVAGCEEPGVLGVDRPGETIGGGTEGSW